MCEVTSCMILVLMLLSFTPVDFYPQKFYLITQSRRAKRLWYCLCVIKQYSSSGDFRLVKQLFIVGGREDGCRNSTTTGSEVADRTQLLTVRYICRERGACKVGACKAGSRRHLAAGAPVRKWRAPRARLGGLSSLCAIC